MTRSTGRKDFLQWVRATINRKPHLQKLTNKELIQTFSTNQYPLKQGTIKWWRHADGWGTASRHDFSSLEADPDFGLDTGQAKCTDIVLAERHGKTNSQVAHRREKYAIAAFYRSTVARRKARPPESPISVYINTWKRAKGMAEFHRERA